MPQFELGGSVSSSVTMTKDNNYTSSFAQELARESLLQSDSVYKSSFATELLETSNLNTSEVKNNSDGDDSNIYENINIKDSLEAQILQQSTLNDSSDFKRLSQVCITILSVKKRHFNNIFQIFNSTMVGNYTSSPRESLSSISRVQTVVSISGQNNHNNSSSFNSASIKDDNSSADMSVNYLRLQQELRFLQEKLNNVRAFIKYY